MVQMRTIIHNTIILIIFILIIAPVLVKAYIYPPASQNPNVWYHFDSWDFEASGDIIIYFHDHGTSPENKGIWHYGSGSDLVEGYYNSEESNEAKGIKITGDDYMEIELSDDLTNTDNLTIEFYVYLSPDFDGALICTSGSQLFSLRHSNSKLKLYVIDTINSASTTIETSQIPSGRWYYVAFSINSKEDKAKIYLNGKKVAEGEIPSSWGIDVDIIKIGGSTYNGYFVMDEFRYYNYTLSDVEIKKHAELIRVKVYDEKDGSEIVNITASISGHKTYDLTYDQSLNVSIIFTPSDFVFGNYILSVKDDEENYHPRSIFVNLSDLYKLVREVDVYLVNKSDETILQIFKLEDFYNQFQEPRLVLKKFIGEELEKVVDIPFDFNKQVKEYLLWNSRYQLSIVDDIKGIELTLGWFTPDPDGLVEIIPNLNELPKLTHDITVEFKSDKITGSIIVNYNCSEEISKAEFYVNCTDGTTAYYSYSTEKTGSFIFNGNNSTSYVVHFIVWSNGKIIYERSWYLGWGGKEILRILPESYPDWVYTVISVGMVIMMLLLFGSFNATAGCALATALAAILWWFGWLNVNEIVLALMGLISASAVIYHHRRRVAV